MRKRISPGVVVGVIAIVIAMSGSAYAAVKITGAQVKDGTLTSADIKNHSLATTDMSSGAVNSLRGQIGPAGPAGAAGPAGPAGPAGTSAVSGITRKVGSLPVAADDIDGGTLYCDPGQRVVGGGFDSDGGFVFVDAPNADRSGWVVAMDNTGFPAATLDAYALCAGAGQAVAARVHSAHLAPLTGTFKHRVAARVATRRTR